MKADSIPSREKPTAFAVPAVEQISKEGKPAAFVRHVQL